MDKIANLNKTIEQKNKLLEETADKLEKIGEEISLLKQKNDNIEKENQTLADSLKEANEKIVKFEKKAAARKLVEELIEKGNLDSLKADETIADFVASPDSIEKISKLTSKLTGNIKNIGEIIGKEDTAEKIAEEKTAEVPTSNEGLANILVDSFKKCIK